jgi:dephospho-CoA kinase
VSWVFGLTGGICAGKTTASNVIAKHDIPIVDADLIARQVVEPGTFLLDDLIETFGREYLNADGTLNRTKLGALVFGDAEHLRVLNKLMLPAINREAKKQFGKLSEEGHRLICFDGATIIESGHALVYKPLILIYCSPETQVQRLMKRNPLSREEALLRVNAQMPVAEKMKYADIPVSTDGTIEETETQITNIVLALKSILKQKEAPHATREN